jgi:hypothetical protein
MPVWRPLQGGHELRRMWTGEEGVGGEKEREVERVCQKKKQEREGAV